MSDNLGRIIIYNTEQGGKIEVKLEENTVWLNQNQISEFFNVGKSTINYHINNILKE